MLQTAEPSAGEDFANDVALGLGTSPKFLLAKYFYDETGSLLFEEITRQPEYYPTRTEASILEANAAAIGSHMGRAVSLVELGSGSSTKTRILLESLLKTSDELRYLPIDISPSILKETADELDEAYPGLDVTPIASQYESGLKHASDLVSENSETADRMLVLFLGSSIGNMEPRQASRFLEKVRSHLGEKDAFLVGFDLVKEAGVLNAAYNDAKGVTAKFNLNVLHRINRELEGRFEVDLFSHLAFFNAEKSRIEMHLVSAKEQRVRIGALDKTYSFRADETIHTESSYKYTPETIRDYASRAGFEIESIFTDERSWFALALMTPA